MSSIVVINGEISDRVVSAAQLLNDFPRGAYTGARTINRNSIVEFSMHLKRLANSLSNLTGNKFEIDQIKELILPSLRIGMLKFIELNEKVEELKITILLCSDSSHFYVHIAELNIPKSPAIAEIRGTQPRENPSIKDSNWAKKRVIYESLMNPNTNEVILKDLEGNLYEGLASNFFVLFKNGTIATAPIDLVLAGTIQNIVVELCNQKQIPIKYELISLNSVSDWAGAFVTSTTRGLLPLKTIYLYYSDDSKEPDQTYNFEIDPILNQLRQDVFIRFQTDSVQILN
eukprot:TRINITY_DN3271_c0_g1_i1.p1 TRINITY_DN3271_c0_g1~~TRINITY_DN3271_c0_g1_i1.p1  ORF type:complete len:287 (-),score=117.96 TRINITY_DN3271_c0_g1_i1:99-959(-)